MNQMTTQGQAPAYQPTMAASGRIKFDLMDPHAFNHIQRVAAMYASSPLFPEHLRKGDHQAAVANAVLCLNIAERLNEDALTVAQNIFFVGGRAGWNATYMIAKANMSGVFKGTIEWKTQGAGKDIEVTAYATLASTGNKVEKTITFAQAEADGWTRNAKYKSIPETMLQYRTAAALIRLYCPEVMIGMPAATEVEDEQAAMRDVSPQPEPAHELRAPAAPANPAVEDAETVEDQAPAPKVNRTPPAPAEVEDEAPEEKPKPAKKRPEPKPEPKPEPEPEPEPEPAEEDTAPEPEAELDLAPTSQPTDPATWSKDWKAFAARIAKELEMSKAGDDDDGDAAGVAGFYHEDLSQMREEAPDIYETVDKRVRNELV
ncbi:hypothetical protein [Sagittula salina]|uniref:RecT family protein n=1 Tax=Sagittula salina TaxID=2820268 RepID=A0A940MMK6_9RHOB|nr:hypothetical protein [Sagittula salina]MBP0484645.1 hypothetical protein [Sagittula salina]